MDSDILVHILDGREKPTNLPFALLKNITDNFSEDRVIGEGGFAKVYKGVLPNGSVAVKRIKNSQTINEKLFYRELDSLLTINHKNAVRFLGFCASTEHGAIKIEGSRLHRYYEMRERLLCFEYISNGNLQNHITNELRGLEWNTRYQIIKGICEGLHHLHQEKHIFHMDLKPANILLNNYMVPKITDFGLSRLDEISQTSSLDRCGTFGYCAPEYKLNGNMSYKSDMFSLGVIITELVTGHKSIPDNNTNNVLRRWRYRWIKTGKESPLEYQQVAKCMKIGSLCQEIDPSKRPYIWEVINDIREMEDIDGKTGSACKYAFGQISPYSEDDMLGVEPLELHFPFKLNKQISCSLKLTNHTDGYIAFNIRKMSPLPYCMKPEKDIVPPGASYSVDITLQAQAKVPTDRQGVNEFTVQSTKVTDCFAPEGITTDMFSNESGVVDAVVLDVFFDAVVYKDKAPRDRLCANNFIGRSTEVDDGLAGVMTEMSTKWEDNTVDKASLPTSSSKVKKRVPKIENFRHPAPTLDPDQAAKLCKIVTDAIHEYYAGGFPDNSAEELERAVYYMVLLERGEMLYSAVETAIYSEVVGIRRALDDTGLDGMLFLQELLPKWRLHKKAASYTRDIVMYMDRSFVPKTKRTPTYDMALRVWLNNVVCSGNVLPRLIAEVWRQREREDTWADLVGVTEMLSELGNGNEAYRIVMDALLREGQSAA